MKQLEKDNRILMEIGLFYVNFLRNALDENRVITGFFDLTFWSKSTFSCRNGKTIFTSLSGF